MMDKQSVPFNQVDGHTATCVRSTHNACCTVPGDDIKCQYRWTKSTDLRIWVLDTHMTLDPMMIFHTPLFIGLVA